MLFRSPLLVRPIPAEEWATSWRAEFPILRVGRIVVRPPWREHLAEPEDAVVTIDPGQAFGTGLHPTTRLALIGIERWGAAGRLGEFPLDGPGVLDVGTGSGILLLAAIALGASHGTGVDIDPVAVVAARQNALQNRAAAEFIEANQKLAGEFDVVIANILANPLKLLAPVLARATRAGGRIVLSGVLDHQAGEVTDCYAAWFDMEVPIHEDGWALLSGRRR